MLLLKNNVLAYSYFQSSRIFLLEPQTKMSVHIEEVPKDLEEQVEELHAQVVIFLCWLHLHCMLHWCW